MYRCIKVYINILMSPLYNHEILKAFDQNHISVNSCNEKDTKHLPSFYLSVQNLNIQASEPKNIIRFFFHLKINVPIFFPISCEGVASDISSFFPDHRTLWFSFNIYNK